MFRLSNTLKQAEKWDYMPDDTSCRELWAAVLGGRR
jgi:hypothetical protein